MGRFAFTLVAGVLFSGAAEASSIIALEAMEEPIGPSMIVIGAPAQPAMVKEQTPTGTQLAYPYPGGVPAPVISVDTGSDHAGKAADGFIATSPSIVGMAVPDGTVSDEKVAAIDEEKNAHRRGRFTPMVIRGGIVGDAFSRTVAPTPTSEPQSETASAEPAGQGAPEPQPEAEAAPPPPSGLPELSAPR